MNQDGDVYYMEFGEVAINQADDINIPIGAWVCSPEGVEDEDAIEGRDKYWHWYADNYQPRRGALVSQAYHIAAVEKHDILKAVRKYVVPLYAKALKGLAKRGETSWSA